MRMSCNGCRILRKGCSENCSIRPCLQWIKSPDSQANATVFLAKFYGRAGLINLINAGPDHLRPAIFRSLLYEACGRIVNPIYGSVGLLWSGTWHLCQSAVEAVLRGAPITPIASEAAATSQGPPLKAYDIRHVSKDESSGAVVTAEPPASDRLKVRAGRCRFKRSGRGGDAAAAGKVNPRKMDGGGGGGGTAKWAGYCAEVNRSDDSSVSHQSEAANAVDGGESKETESMVSAETVELAASQPPPPPPMMVGGDEMDEPGLELTLGFEPASRVVPVKKRRVEALIMSNGGFDGACKTELGLECPA